MTLLKNAIRAVISSQSSFGASVPVHQHERAQLPDAKYETYAREGYSRNTLIYACIEELSTSAAEPSIQVKIGDTWTSEDPLVALEERPNPFMDAFEYWATVIMHRSLAGNAYALIVRSGSMKPVQKWLMRPDRVRVVPSRDSYISHYEYHVGDGEVVRIPVNDVIHYKTRNPLNQWYGMPPLMAASGRTDIDNWMEDFVKGAFTSGGMPGAILNVKQKVSPEDKEAIRRRFRDTYSGPRGWHELLILDNAEASYTPLTMSLGARGLVIPELDQISEARIPMVFGVPQSLIGTRTSYENGGYANKRAEENHFWTGTLVPLYKELIGPEKRVLMPNFPRVKDMRFDLSTVEALQGDFGQLANIWSGLANKGIASLEEARAKVGLSPEWDPQHTFLVPSNTPPMTGDALDEPEMAPVTANQPQIAAPAARIGRPSTANDPEARALWQKGEELKAQFPNMTNEQIASRLGISERTLRRYRDAFADD